MKELLGKPIRIVIIEQIQQRIEKKQTITAYLIYNPASFEASAYMNLIAKLMTKLNIPHVSLAVDEYSAAEKKIEELNQIEDSSIFICRPLLFKFEEKLIEMVNPLKDADMMTSTNIGKLTKGDLHYLSGTSCSVKKIIDYYNVPIEGKRCVVLGRSVSVGMPIALMLIKENGLVSVVHSRISQENISKVVQEADVVVLATGKRGLVLKEDIKSHQTIIDCGYQEDGMGDLGFVPECEAFTPVPGGVGPITIAQLILNAFYLKYGE